MNSSFRMVWLAKEAVIQQFGDTDARLLRWIQFLLVFAIATLSFSMNSIQSYLNQNLQSLLGADLLLTQEVPLSPKHLQYLSQSATKTSKATVLSVTISQGDLWQQTQLKFVDHNYPLKGDLVTSDSQSGTEKLQNTGPNINEIWLDSRAMAALEVKVGQTVMIGNHELIVAQVLIHEPDRLLEGHSFTMRAMLNLSTFDALQLDSQRLTYRYLFSMDNDNVKRSLNWLQNNLPSASVLYKNSGHPLALFWKRTENFLGLSSVLLFLMGAIAINFASQRQIQKHVQYVAVCMSMGVSKGRAIALNVVQWIMEFVMILLPALTLGYLCHLMILDSMSGYFDGIFAVFNWNTLVSIVSTMLFLLLTLKMPSWFVLSRVSVARLLRPSESFKHNGLKVIWTMACLFSLAVFYSDNYLLTALTFAMLTATTILVLLVTWLLLFAGYLLSFYSKSLWVFSFYLMRQRLIQKSAQILGISLCATLLLFTLMFMRDIGDTMRQYTRTHDGNLFIAQLNYNDLDKLKGWLQQTDSQLVKVKPYYRAMLHTINGMSIDTFSQQPSDTKSALKSAIRLHWTDPLPENNRLLKGQWWESKSIDWQQVSVEQEVMFELGLRTGDTLTFEINQQMLDFKVVASHAYQSGHGSVTFWFQAPEAIRSQLQGPAFWMGSIEVSDRGWQGMSQLYRDIPTLRAMSLQQLTSRFDEILNYLTQVVLGSSLLICALALLVIISAVKGAQIADKRKNGLLLSFGLSESQCVRLTLYEWIITAIIAAVGAIAGTLLAGRLIYQSQFSLTYSPDSVWLLSTLSIMLITVVTVGWLSSRKALQVSIRDLLSE
jgi:putative ABC transport system permease protein